jgi:type II secretory pathway component PulF
MPSYIYKAKNNSAQTVSGRLNAQNQDEAVDVIYRQGLVPVSVEEETGQGVLVSDIKESRVKPKTLFLFTKQLAGLIKSGVTLLKSLEVIAAQTKNVYFGKVLTDIADGVKSGRTLSSCLSDYPSIFPGLYIALIRAGEEMGNLKAVLADIAEFLKRQDEMSSKVRGALVYPLVMLCVGAATVFFILIFVMPKISAIFANTGAKLPLPTEVVMSLSRFLKHYWPFVLVFIGASTVFINRWRKSLPGQITIGRWLLRTPFINELVIKADLARFARTTHLLLESGLTLVKAMEIAAPTIHNPQLRADIFICAEGLNAGESLGATLSKSSYFPEVFTQVLAVAEEGGGLEESLKDIAESCENDVNEAVRSMMTLMEPLMILAVGLVVGFIVFAMLLPIFSMDIMAR